MSDLSDISKNIMVHLDHPRYGYDVRLALSESHRKILEGQGYLPLLTGIAIMQTRIADLKAKNRVMHEAIEDIHRAVGVVVDYYSCLDEEE